MVVLTTVLTAWAGTPVARAAQDPAPVLVEAQGLTDAAVRLIWTAVPGAESYVVYRDGVGIAWPTGTRYDDTPLAPSATYSYQVSSVVGGVESAPSTTVSTNTQAPEDHSPPTRPGVIKVSNIRGSSATLKWGASTDDVAVLGYLIFRGPPNAAVTELVQIAAAEDSTSYSAKNLKSGTAYQFAVVAIDAGGNRSSAETKTFNTDSSNDSSPPAAPSSSSVSAKVFSATRIDVVWGTSNSSDVAGYKVYRDGVAIAEVALPLRRNYSDNGLAPGSAHNYQIQTFDSAGNLSPLTTGRIATTTAAGVVQIQRGPYLQWTTGDSVRVAWWTNIPAGSTVSYGIGGLSNQVTDASPTTHHVMLIGGLSPGATYTYQVTSGGAVSPVATLSTAAPRGATFSFAAVGDYGGGSPQETAIANLIADAGTQFVQTLGDNVYPQSEDPDFATTYSDFDSRLYKPYGEVMKEQTFWAGGGNHEYFGGDGFWENFWLPNNERWYGYDWGDAHFLVLDAEQPLSPGTPQYRFAEADLAANQDDVWRIAVVHRPPYSSTSNNSSSGPVRTNLVPLLQQQRVQLALTAHSHNYERTYPLVDDVPADGGVTYIVSGGGGNGLNQFVIPQPSWSAFRQASFEYLRVLVSPSAIQVEARSDADVLIDSVTLGPGGPPPPSGSIGGAVTDAGTGDPLVGAMVSYAGGSDITDEFGAYSLSGVVPGTHSVTASATGYSSRTETVVVNAGALTQQDFALTSLPHVPVFSDGFESGNLSAWTSSSGLTVQTAIVHSGAYAARGTTTNGTTYAKKTLSLSYGEAYSRIYFQLVGFSSQVNLLRNRTSADSSIAYLFVNTSGKLGLRNDVTATTTTSTTTVTTGGWHSLELHLVINGASSTVEVWLDGARMDDLSGTRDLGSSLVGRLQIGEVASGRTYDVVFDDVVFDTQRVGP